MQPFLHQSPHNAEHLGPLLPGDLFLAALSEPQHCLLAQSIERRILAEELELVRASKKVVMGFPEVQGEMWEADGDALKEDLTFIPREPVCSSFVQSLLRSRLWVWLCSLQL